MTKRAITEAPTETPKPPDPDKLGAVVIKGTERPAADPNRCTCVGVERRYDQDGLIAAHGDAPNDYRCVACGRAYS